MRPCIQHFVLEEVCDVPCWANLKLGSWSFKALRWSISN